MLETVVCVSVCVCVCVWLNGRKRDGYMKKICVCYFIEGFPFTKIPLILFILFCKYYLSTFLKHKYENILRFLASTSLTSFNKHNSFKNLTRNTKYRVSINL